jgi:hypothetical protein
VQLGLSRASAKGALNAQARVRIGRGPIIAPTRLHACHSHSFVKLPVSGTVCGSLSGNRRTDTQNDYELTLGRACAKG